MKPKVTIIIPTYNRAKFLPETIVSVLAQSMADFECIVIDDGSSDGTQKLMEDICARDERVRYLRQQNRGPSAARNLGLREAKGQYIQFLDSDDIITREKLEKQLVQLEREKGLSLSYCDYRYCAHDDINKTTRRDKLPPPRLIMSRPLWDIASRWETGLSIPIHCFLFDARIFREYAVNFDVALPNHEDWDCWMRVFSLDPAVYHIAEIMAIYRLHDDSICVDRHKLALGFEKAIKKQRREFGNDPIMRRLLSNKLGEIKADSERKAINIWLSKFNMQINGAYKKLMPWPVQKFIASIREKIT